MLLGTLWALRWARRRSLDPDALLDMAVWLVLGGIVGARLVYVLTSPGAYFGPGGNPIDAFAVWRGGISIHGGVLGVVVATWLYSRRHGLNMWAYLDVMTPIGALGIIGGRLGNIMNGSDTTGRLTGWPVGVTWPEPGSTFLGGFGRAVFGTDLWAYYTGDLQPGERRGLGALRRPGRNGVARAGALHAGVRRAHRRAAHPRPGVGFPPQRSAR